MFGLSSLCGATRTEPGVIYWDGASVLDVNMSLSHWKHSVTKLARVWWAKRAHVEKEQVCQLNWAFMDRMVGKPKQILSSVATMLTGTFLTAALQNTVFWDRSGRWLRCGEWDSQIHRMLWCQATDHLRRASRMGPEDVSHILRQGAFWATRGVILKHRRFRQDYPNRCEGTSYLRLLGQHMHEEARVLGFEGDPSTFVVGTRAWRGDAKITAICMQGSLGRVIQETTGLGVKQATFAGVLRVLIGAKIRGLMCRIHSEYPWQGV